MKIIKLKKGDKIVSTLEARLLEMDIATGFLWGLGAISDAELMIYNLETKEYATKKLSGTFEVVSFSATITEGMDGKKVMIHPHVILSKEDFSCVGGHLKEATVAATLEVGILESKEKLGRYHDKNIGLNLIK